MILLLIQECFVARGGDKVGLFWLVLLQDFSIIHTWDWSGLILSVLYESMDSFSRLVSTCHRGLSMLWEVRRFFLRSSLFVVLSHSLFNYYFLLSQSWFMAYAGRGRISYREDTPDQFPVYRRFHQRNVVSPYRYLTRAHCVNDVTGLTAGQVCFFPL